MTSIPYFGNSAYCYSNSTSMLLSYYGENISPSLIESLSGVGLGAFEIKGMNIAFLSNYAGLPDQGISAALNILGFEYNEKFQEEADSPHFENLKRILETSPAVLGPLDMGYLSYDPHAKNHFGVDHFVLAYAIDEENVYLHDPAGFPYVSLSLDQLKAAWKANSIRYKRGHYRYWSHPTRKESPTNEKIYKRAIKRYKEVYSTGEKYGAKKEIRVDSNAILWMAENIEKNLLKPHEIGLLTGFIFSINTRRSLDISNFLTPYNNDLAKLKDEQARLLGECHVLTVKEEWSKVAQKLREYSDLEDKFKTSVLDL